LIQNIAVERSLLICVRIRSSLNASPRQALARNHVELAWPLQYLIAHWQKLWLHKVRELIICFSFTELNLFLHLLHTVAVGTAGSHALALGIYLAQDVFSAVW
jgi:hypothetical protein